MHGLYWLCANLTQRGPVLITVDDAQWADEPSLRWLAYLARRLVDLPLLLVVAARGDGADRREALGTIQAEAVTSTFELRPLGDDNAGAILASLTGVQPAPEVVRACHARSAGNPFVLGELASAIAQAGVPIDAAESAALVETMLPTSVAEIVLLRLGSAWTRPPGLAPHAIAVLGRDVSLVDAGWLAGLEPEDAASAMDRLVDAGLLERGLPLRFTHPLMREAIYEDSADGTATITAPSSRRRRSGRRSTRSRSRRT